MLLLAGVALNALLAAATSFLISLSFVRYEVAQEVLFWMMGGLDVAQNAYLARFDGIGIGADDVPIPIIGGTGALGYGLAVRLARAHTGRAKLLKFAGGYHGHADALLARAGSGLATLGIPSSPGVPSWPYQLAPQAHRVPSVRRARRPNRPRCCSATSKRPARTRPSRLRASRSRTSPA